MKARWAPWLAWGLAGLYVVLTVSGQALQVLAGRPWEPALGFSGVAFLSLAVVIWSVIGAVIVSRQPGNPIGWILCLVPLTGGIDDFAFGYAVYSQGLPNGSLPGVNLTVVWTAVSGGPFVVALLMLLFLLFPDGRYLSPRWRLVAWLGIGALAVVVPLQALRPGPLEEYPFLTNPIGVGGSIWIVLNPLQSIMLPLAMLCFLAAAFSLLLRLRRARGDERQQIKWLAYTAAFFPFGISLLLLQPTRAFRIVAWVLQGVTLVGMPIATAVAIFKYRLFDIDLIIHRTLVYGALTGALALVYYLSVVFLQQLFPASSQFSIVLSTLAVAALFSPLRGRIQNAIDRRFYRRKYDAQQTLAAFSADMRDEVELEQLSETLVSVVGETLQPAFTKLWLKEAEKSQD